MRLKMLKSPNEEYTKMVDSVMKLALRNTSVSFTLKRDSQVEADIHTNGKESSILDNMKLLYGSEMVKDIYQAKIVFDDTPYRFQCEAHFTGIQYSVISSLTFHRAYLFFFKCSSKSGGANSFTFILFINGRLVECQPLKKSLQQMYSVLINKQISPFIYADLTMDPSTLDVNIHPSKNEVRFLHSDPIIVSIVQSIERVLTQKSAKQTTTSTTQLTFHIVRIFSSHLHSETIFV